jgi:septal ring factor EnvC (AmiA/AmiB activator)
MKAWILGLVVAIAASAAIGEVPIEEAQARLDAKKNEKKSDLGSEIGELKQEIQRLRNENQSLRDQLASLRAAATQPTEASAPEAHTEGQPARGKDVHVNGYTRKDGTYVRPHDRSAPGSGHRK